MEDSAGDDGLAGMMERASLCMAGPCPNIAAHDGDEYFLKSVLQHYTVQENNAVEKLVLLKAELREASTYDFWRILMEGMTSITNAQYGFVAKRILVDDEDSAVEMPQIGEPGSCLLGVAFYYNDGHELKNLHRDFKYLAYGAPCQSMRHDKVFLIPNGLPQFVTHNPNDFPFPTEAYLAVPLFAEGKCFAHFGMMWNDEGLERKPVSWPLAEMLLHSLEDLILERLLEGQGFAQSAEQNRAARVIPHEAITAAQSLKPYARSLSHELRTPMQGVVGMLDVMHATVQESLEGQSDAVVRKVLKTLRENIETVQDSSRRAVEAADNVVHAYDLNMQIPDTPVQQNDEEGLEVQSTASAERRPSLLTESNSVFFRKNKRPRTTSVELTPPASKHRVVQSNRSTPHREHRAVSPHTASLRSAVEESDEITTVMEGVLRTAKSVHESSRNTPTVAEPELSADAAESELASTPGLKHTRIRELLHLVINESLRVGGRPDSAVAEDTEGGEIIEVRTKQSKGGGSSKIIEWSVDARVPDMIFVDERDLAKLVSCVFLNAVKFTERGKITLTTTMSPKSRSIVINVVDTGPGIPEDFIPYLFRPFSREDDSLTRQKEGLGLGLLVAKGIARKIGGDLLCIRSDTSGPRRGSEFELRVPISATDPTSRGSTPRHTSTPSRRQTDDSPVPSHRGRQPSTVTRRRNSQKNISAPTAKTSNPTQGQQDQSSAAHQYVIELGYYNVYEAENGAEAVSQMAIDRRARKEQAVDVILMDLWMPTMDGYEAAQRIFDMERERRSKGIPNQDDDDRARRKRALTVLAVSADVTDSALERASEVGMEGYMTKPYKLLDLERLILEYCTNDPYSS